MAFQLVLFILMLTLSISEAGPNYDVDLSTVLYDGGFTLFPVKREKVQQRLDEINSQSADDDVKLYLPAEPVLQHVIGCEEHVVMIAFGNETAVAFEEALTDQEKETVSTVTKGLWIEIPYLSSKEGGQPELSLQMKTFNKDVGYNVDANLILAPPVIADRLCQDRNGNNIDIHLEKDDLQMHLTGRQGEPCTFPAEHVYDDVNEYLRELQISQSGPNFEICDRFPDLDVDFCDVYRNETYAEILNEAGWNVCQYWKPTIDVKSCKASLQIASMSDEMRELLLLEDETQDAIETEIETGNFGIKLVFPCIE